MSEKKYALLPADDAVQNWFEENIDKECSASSAVYKFRQWLESLQVKQPGPGWVPVNMRLPGWKARVKWRDGNDHYNATKGGISLFEMDKPNLEGWEWYDETNESPAEQPVADELKQLRRWKMEAAELLTKINSYAHKHLEMKLGECAVDFVIDRCKELDRIKAEQPGIDNARYELSLALRMLLKVFKNDQITNSQEKYYSQAEAMLKKHSKVTDILRTEVPEQPVREVEFAEWCDDNYYRKYGVWRHRSNHEEYTTAQLWEIFKKEK